ncbi:MAG TPA: preprotein translocase subunit SecE [bacterium]|nr:preprotein translocase subunit SecE [bacterium]
MKTNLPTKVITFLKEVKTETKRVNWPTREETIRYTLIVVGVSLAVAAYLGGLDIIIRFIIKNLRVIFY